MRIVVDARAGVGTGIGRYATELLDALQECDSENQYIVLLTRGSYDKWDPRRPNFVKRLADYRMYGLKEQLVLPWLLYRLHADLVHFTHVNAPVSYVRPHVTTIHDLTLVTHRNATGAGIAKLVYEVKYWLMRVVLRTIIVTSRRIITPSEFVKRELLTRFGTGPAALQEESVCVTHLAASSLESAGTPSSSYPERFLLYVGNSYPHKNLDRLLEAFAVVRRDHNNLHLVLVGQVDYFYEQVRRRSHELHLESAVCMPGYASERDLAWLYANALAFVFPSVSEGFGLPALEAMARGTPVISSDATSLPEVCADAAEYFDPYDVGDIARAILAVVGNAERRQDLSARGRARSAKFSWLSLAERTQKVYAEASRA